MSEIIKTNTLSPNLEEYIEAVENLAKNKDGFIFRNSSHLHAAVVLSKMMKYTENEFLLYDDNLSGDIADKHDGFYTELGGFMANKKDAILKIVIDNHNQEGTKIYEQLKAYALDYPNRVFVSRSTSKFREAISDIYNIPLNFAVSDSRAFRLEETGKKNEQDRKAFCSFNKTDIATKLKTVFDREFVICPKIF